MFKSYTKRVLNPTRTIVSSLFIAALLLCGITAYTDSSQAPTGYTNAPGESNCTTCHTGSSIITSGTNWNNMTLSTDIPGTGYVPDSTYNITLSYAQSGIVRFGFSTTVLNSGNTKAGTLILTNTTTQSLSSGTRDYIGHKAAGTAGSGSISWSFKWKAPASASVGNVTFYSVVNSTNNNSNSTGDQIYGKTFTFSPTTLLPTAVITPSATTICTGDTLYLQGSGANNPTIFTWGMPGGSPASSSLQNPKVVYTTAGSYTVTLTTRNAIGNSTPATVNITVTQKPSPAISANHSLSLCPGDSVILTSLANGNGITYAWSNGPSTQAIVVKTSGNYQVTVTNTITGCVNKSAIQQVVLRNPPAVFITSSDPNDSICQGDPITFTATAGFASYLFKNSTNILQNSSNRTYQTSSLPASSKVLVIATDSNGCKSTSPDSIKTYVAIPPAAPAVTCGTSTTGSVTFTWAAVSGAAGYEVSLDTGKTWGNPSSGANGLSHAISGLSYSQQVQIQVRAKTTAPCFVGVAGQQTCSTLSCSGITYNLKSDTAVCAGDPARFTFSNISSSGYAISFNNQPYSKDTQFSANPFVTKNYSIILIDSGAINCPPISLNMQVKVNNKPIAQITSDKINNITCVGTPVTFTAGAGGNSYTFVRNGTDTLQKGSTTTCGNVKLQPGDSVWVRVGNSSGCFDESAHLKMTVNNAPVVNLASDKINNTGCVGDTITFTGSGNYASYSFIRNNTDTLYKGTAKTLQSPQIVNGDSMHVFIVDTQTCIARSTKIQMTLMPLPAVSFLYTKTGINQLTFTPSSTGFSSYKWDFGDGATSNQISPVHTYTGAGPYTIKLTVVDANGCKNSTQFTTISLGNSHLTPKQNLLYIYPNPVDEELNMVLDPQMNGSGKVDIYNVSGQLLRSIPFDALNTTHTLPVFTGNLPKGVYIVQVQSEGISALAKFIK